MSDRDWTELAPAYVLGALEPDERAAFEARLAEDPSLQSEVDRYQETVGVMGLAAGDHRPPPGLRETILARARGVAQDPEGTEIPAATGGEAGSTSVAPPDGPAGTGGTRADRTGHSAERRRPARTALGAWVPWLAAAASLVVALGLWSALQRISTEQARLQTLYDDAIAELAAAEVTRAAQDSLLAALSGPQVHVAALSPPEGEPALRVFWNHTLGRFVVTAFQLPPAPPGQTYQLWAIVQGQAPISMGTFNTDPRQQAILTLPVPDAIAAIDVVDLCALTLEPGGGSPQPTENPRLVGEWRHSD